MIEKGSKGTEVANWQRFLISQGYNIEADGDFGKATDLATKDFQASRNLRPDGKVGDMTYKAAEPLNVNIGSQKPTDIPAQPTTGLSNTYNEVKLQQVHPALAHRARKILEFAKADGYELRVSQGLRTFKEQDDLFRKRPRVTQARGGQSYHNFAAAVDFAFVVDGKISWDEKLYKNIGRWAKNADLEWGGNWKRFVDLPHCQLPNLPPTKVLLGYYNKGGLTEVWRHIG